MPVHNLIIPQSVLNIIIDSLLNRCWISSLTLFSIGAACHHSLSPDQSCISLFTPPVRILIAYVYSISEYREHVKNDLFFIAQYPWLQSWDTRAKVFDGNSLHRLIPVASDNSFGIYAQDLRADLYSSPHRTLTGVWEFWNTIAGNVD